VRRFARGVASGHPHIPQKKSCWAGSRLGAGFWHVSLIIKEVFRVPSIYVRSHIEWQLLVSFLVRKAHWPLKWRSYHFHWLAPRIWNLAFKALQNNFVLKTSHCISWCAKEASEGPKSGYLSGSLESCIGGDSNPSFRERQLLYDSAKCVWLRKPRNARQAIGLRFDCPTSLSAKWYRKTTYPRWLNFRWSLSSSNS
jgi:hypothetical protein